MPKGTKERKPREVNLLNIILLVVVVALNLALAFQCHMLRQDSSSRVEGLMIIAIVGALHYPLCLACDVYAGLHLKDSWYFPVISPLIFYIIEPVGYMSTDDPVEFLKNLAAHMLIMLLVAGIAKLLSKIRRKKGKNGNDQSGIF